MTVSSPHLPQRQPRRPTSNKRTSSLTGMRFLFAVFAILTLQLCTAEVGDFQPHLIVQQDTTLVSGVSKSKPSREYPLLRLEIPVDDSPFVHELDGVDELGGVVSRRNEVKRAILRKVSAEWMSARTFRMKPRSSPLLARSSTKSDVVSPDTSQTPEHMRNGHSQRLVASLKVECKRMTPG
jgi:hypothetical protein